MYNYNGMFVLGILMLSVSALSTKEVGAEFEARFVALENTVKKQNAILSQQSMLIEDLRETMVFQKHRIADLNDKLAEKDKTCKDTKDELTGLKHDLDAHDQMMKTKKRFVLDTLETVAFEATISGGTKLPHTQVNDRIIFETVSLNVGNGYQSGNGTFIAPIGGIYIFSTSVMMTSSSNTQDPGMHVVIEKNGAEVAGAFAYNRGSYEHSSVTAAMSLNVGDTVFISVERHADITFYGDRLSSFMGFLLYPF